MHCVICKSILTKKEEQYNGDICFKCVEDAKRDD